jgi:hypothetical protein
MRPRQVTSPDRGGETELGAVGERNRFFFRIERDDADHGTENFFLGDPHLIADIGEDGR